MRRTKKRRKILGCGKRRGTWKVVGRYEFAVTFVEFTTHIKEACFRSGDRAGWQWVAEFTLGHKQDETGSSYK
jgi:hypothetical protein